MTTDIRTSAYDRAPTGFAPRGTASRLVTGIVTLVTRRQSRQRLTDLSEHLLRDIGIDRSHADAEAAKPFWRE